MELHFLIVDDEVYICKLIAKFVSDIYPDSTIGLAHSGNTALEYIRKNRPHIVITDIRIPEMDGIELVRICHEEGIRSRFVIVSGYKKFEYAHNALKYGVVDYLLKPIRKEELENVLREAETSIRNESELEVHEASMQDQIHAFRKQLRDKTLSDLLEGRDADLSGYVHSLHTVMVVKLSIISGMRDNDVFRRMVINNIRNYAGAFFPAAGKAEADMLPYEDEVVFLIGFEEDTKEFANGRIKELASSVITWAEQHTDFKVSIGISRIFGRVDGFVNAYQAARRCSFAHLLYGFSQKFREERFEGMTDIPNADREEIRTEFRKRIEAGDARDLRLYLEPAMHRVASINNLHPYSLYSLYTDLSAWLDEYVLSLSLEEGSGKILRGENSLAGSYQQFIRLTVDEIVARVQETEERKKQVEEMPVALAKQYIHSHMNEDISLETVADKVHLSRSYFSTLFKKITGRNFIDYVIEARMEEAKRLLSESQLPIGEIAEAVGYQDIKSFSKRFKKEVGIVPTKFRKYHLDARMDWWT